MDPQILSLEARVAQQLGHFLLEILKLQQAQDVLTAKLAALIPPTDRPPEP